MKFKDCIGSAREQGVLSKEEADSLIARYEAHRKAHAGDADPDAAAQTALASELDATAARQRYLAELAVAKRDEIAADISAYRSPKGEPDVFEAAMRKLEHFGFTGFSSVKGRMLSIVSLAHGELAEVLRKFERSFITGFHHQAPAARDLVREILGEATGSAEARAMAAGISGQFEKLRVRFNEAGGAIGKLEGGYLPQFHDPLSIKRTGFDAWAGFIRGKLDVGRMKDPLTGGPLTPDALDDSLRAAYRNIVSGGWANREPQAAPAGRGALANQRDDHRFFHFKSADDWLDYAKTYGQGDPIKAVFQHINGMARDIASLEVLGPNPAATVEWLKQVLISEHGKAMAGDGATLFRVANWTTSGETDAGRVAAQRVADLWGYVRGRGVVSQTLNKAAGDVRNVLTSIQLGSASITAAFTDPAIDRAARQQLGLAQSLLFGANAKVYLDTVGKFFSELPVLKSITWAIDHMTGAPREQALRSGLIMEEFLHVLGDEARFAGTLGGNVWSRWLADRTVNLSGLAPMTEARKAVLALDLQGHLADMAGKGFADLPERLRVKMEGYGFDAAQWDRMRAVAPTDGLLRPIDIANVDRGIAERYLEMILGETERAVPTSNARGRSRVTGGAPAGTWHQELVNSFLQYRGFGVSLMTLQFEAIAHETARMGKAAGASYAAQTMILATLGGAFVIQAKQLANGRDPQDMKDAKFWLSAMATGGGFGLFGDFLFADLNRFGHSFGEQLAGPTVSLLSDILKLTVGNAQELAQGKPTKAGREAAAFVGRYMPIASSLWYTRLAYKRELVDQLQYMLDPEAHRAWREEERRAARERGQGYWWRPGETAPARAPDLSTALGR